MEDKNSGFKFSIDEESPDAILQDETKDSRIEKLSKRITLLSLLILLLIGAVLAFVYLDLKSRLDKISGTESTGVSRLSKDLESRFSILSIKQAKLEDILNKKILSIEKKFSSLKTNLKKTEKRIDVTNKNIKSLNTSKYDLDKDINAALDKTLGKLEKTLDPIRKDLGDVKSNIKSIDKRFKQDLAKLAGAVNSANNELVKLIETVDETDKEIKIIKREISSQPVGEIDQRALDLRLKKERRSYIKLLIQIREDLESKIVAIQRKLNKIEKSAE